MVSGSRAAAIAAIAASGPVAMWLAGFQVALVLVLPAAAALGLVAAHRLGSSPWARLAAAVVALAVVGASTGAVVALWLVAGAAYGDWIVSDRPPLRPLPTIPPGATAMALVLLAPSWLLPNDVFRTLPLTASAALALVAVAGTGARRQRRWAAAGIALAGYATVAFLAAEDLNAVPSVLLLAAAALTMAAVGWAQASTRWSLGGQLGPLAGAAPALVWWMVNVGIWATGVEPSGSIGYRAWVEGMSRLDTGVHDALALVGAPVAVLGLLAIGASLATSGRAVTGPIVRAIAVATTSAAVLGWLWTVQPPLG